MTGGARLRQGLIAIAIFIALIAASLAYALPTTARHVAAGGVAAASSLANALPTVLEREACQPESVNSTSTTPAVRPMMRAINIGWSDVVDRDPNHLKELAKRLDEVHANAVAIAIGRMQWLGFPWAGHQASWSSDVKDTGTDFVARAIGALRCDDHGIARRVTLSIDTLMPLILGASPQLAGRGPDGEPSTLFASITAWKTGALTQRLVNLARELVARYHPDAINITELIFERYTFGVDDKADFTATTGLTSWPVGPDGSSDIYSPAIERWRSQALSDVVKQVRRALATDHVELTIDVLAPVTDNPDGRPEAGQDYPMLLQNTDLLNVWDFPGEVGPNGSGTFDSAELAQRFFDAAPTRYSLEIGLWQSGGGIVSVDTLRHELKGANDNAIRSVSVTPASKMTPATWAAVADAWRPQAPSAAVSGTTTRQTDARTTP